MLGLDSGRSKRMIGPRNMVQRTGPALREEKKGQLGHLGLFGPCEWRIGDAGLEMSEVSRTSVKMGKLSHGCREEGVCR